MKPQLLAVIGKPVLHSRSPAIHNAALKAAGITGTYLRLAPKNAGHALRVAAELGISGLNVTAPFKEEMAAAVNDLSSTARAVKAVNTVQLKGGETFGWNTDIFGIQQAFTQHGVTLKGARAVVLGAGGAARAAVIALRDAGATVTVANRTKEKAQALAAEFGCKASSLERAEITPVLRDATVILNVTATVERVLDKELLTASHVVMDSNYAKRTALIEDAKAQGATVVDGKEWLIFQGVDAFKHFTGREIAPAVMRDAFEKAGSQFPKRISFVGMMGAGKSTAAKILSEKLGWTLLELDEQITARAGKSIPAIFADDGEPAFRDIESAVLQDALTREEVILSCGGGIVLNQRNRALLKSESLCVWLWAKPKELANRVGHDPERPLLAGGDPEAKLCAILEQRLPLYADACGLLLPTEGLTPSEIVERILYEGDYLRKS